MKISVQRRTLGWLGWLVAVLLLGYWVKCQMGFDVVGRASLSGWFPFRQLQPESILPLPAPGVVFSDSFDGHHLYQQWASLWMQEPGTVAVAVGDGGRAETRCLVVTNTGEGTWGYACRQFIEVEQGDRFLFSGFARVEGSSAKLAVSAFDENLDAVEWGYTWKHFAAREGWARVDLPIAISNGVAFIKVRVAGSKRGECRFDDIRLVKEDPSPPSR